MLGVGLPVDVEGELHEGMEALFARAQRVRGTPAQRAELAEQRAQREEDGEAQRVVRRQPE